MHTRTGRPLGDVAFLTKIETLLGRGIPIRGKGRPKGSKDQVKRPPRQAK